MTPPLPDRIAAAIDELAEAAYVCGWNSESPALGAERDVLESAIAEVVAERDAAQAKLAKVERQLGSARAQIQNLTSTVRPWWVVFGMERSDARGFHDDVRNLGFESVERSMRLLAEKAGKRGIHPAEVARALDESCEELRKAAAEQGGA